MFAVLLVLAAATPLEPAVSPDAEEAETTAPVFDAWAGLKPAADENDGDDGDDDDDDNVPFTPPPAPPQAAAPQKTLSILQGLGVVFAAGLVPVVLGGVGVGATFAALYIFKPQLGWGVLLIFPAVAIPAMAIGVPVGAELGGALFGDPNDRAWVNLGAMLGAGTGYVLAVIGLFARLPIEGAAILGAAALPVGSAVGTGVVLLARHTDLLE